MSGDIIFVFGLIGVAAVLMASNRLRYDIVALLVVLALMLSGILTVNEALAGFGNPVVILVAGLLVVGEMLDRTGVAVAVGNLILKKGGSNETKLLIAIMVGAALLGAVMSSTAVVAIFIPIVLRIAAETGLNASRLLMPMSYAALISGMLTLIATAPNMVVSEELEAAGFEGFGFFSFTLVGFAVLGVAITYILLVGRRLLPGDAAPGDINPAGRSITAIWDDFRLDQDYQPFTVDPDSPLVGVTVADAQQQSRDQVRIIGIVRAGRMSEARYALPDPELELHSGDRLLLVGRESERQQFAAQQSLESFEHSEVDLQRWFWELGAANLMIHPDSSLVGRSLRDIEFRSNYRVQVLGVRRKGEAQPDFEDTRLATGDSLFVVGAWQHIRRLQSAHHDFVVLETPSEQAEVVPAYRKMPIALAILTGMVLLTLFDIVPLVAAVLIAIITAGATGCLTMKDSYRAVSWSSLVLIAGMLPLADALQVTGGTDLIVDALIYMFGEASPLTMLTVIFFMTAGLGLVLSNTASAVLVAPIAIYAAGVLGVSPYAFGVAVLIAASAAFSSPVSTPVVTLVVEPGRYGFMNFIKVGVPLLLLTYAATAIVAPLVFPFHATP